MELRRPTLETLAHLSVLGVTTFAPEPPRPQSIALAWLDGRSILREWRQRHAAR